MDEEGWSLKPILGGCDPTRDQSLLPLAAFDVEAELVVEDADGEGLAAVYAFFAFLRGGGDAAELPLALALGAAAELVGVALFKLFDEAAVVMLLVR